MKRGLIEHARPRGGRSQRLMEGRRGPEGDSGPTSSEFSGMQAYLFLVHVDFRLNEGWNVKRSSNWTRLPARHRFRDSRVTGVGGHGVGRKEVVLSTRCTAGWLRWDRACEDKVRGLQGAGVAEEPLDAVAHGTIVGE